MSRRTTAHIRSLKLPHLHPDAIRIEVDCSASTTGITHIPGGSIDMDVLMLITFAAYEHEERCDAGCDTSQAHARGDQRAREYVERLKANVSAELIRRRDASRRN